tara:strand:+ start:1213 stop:1764 length:552 start_codon:yes stop_codon:yes gene_type:complete
MIKDKQLKEKTGIEIKQDILENPHKAVYLGIGSNVGNRKNNINNACYLLKNFCSIYKVSNFYETNSWPNENYPKYLNIILKCKTNLDPFSLIKKLKDIEKKLGRKKSVKNFPRTCDIDIIDFRGLKFKGYNVEVPHPRLSKRNFVLMPLFEIEKRWRYPKTNITIDKLIKNLDIKSLRGIKIF